MKNAEIEKVVNQYTQNPVTKKIERVACYVRVSTQEQKLHGLSLDAQRMKLTEYAEENGMKIVEWYIDEGVSGRKLIRNRPELQRMIQDAEKGNFDRIIFIKLDRFFRSVAEYHECMKRIAPVIWTTTEEDYDLTTANGRMLVNMKLTIAELEADQTGERINIVNEYKLSTGQPLTGSMPFGYKIDIDTTTGRKKIIRDPETADVVYDVIDHYLTHQSIRKTLSYLHAKHHVKLVYNSLYRLFKNTMLYGAYRDNPVYCESYVDKDTFDKMQNMMSRNIKENTANRTYLFSGLLTCPNCGCKLSGGMYLSGKGYHYAKYRCPGWRVNHNCDFNKVVAQSTIEKLLLANLEQLLEDVKVEASQIKDSNKVKIPKYDVEAINGEIDRLNYSWQTGKIRKVEQYEKEYSELMEKLEAAEAEQNNVPVKDFSKIEGILHTGWKEIYKKLDDEHKRAFWRSFIQAIEVNWTTETKEISRVIFF